jgi:hypothetical protein
MGGIGVVVRCGGVFMSGGRVLVGFLVVAFDVVFGRQAVMLGGFLVVFCGFVVCFVCHWVSCGKSPGAIVSAHP